MESPIDRCVQWETKNPCLNASGSEGVYIYVCVCGGNPCSEGLLSHVQFLVTVPNLQAGVDQTNYVGRIPVRAVLQDAWLSTDFHPVAIMFLAVLWSQGALFDNAIDFITGLCYGGNDPGYPSALEGFRYWYDLQGTATQVASVGRIFNAFGLQEAYDVAMTNTGFNMRLFGAQGVTSVFKAELEAEASRHGIRVVPYAKMSVALGMDIMIHTASLTHRVQRSYGLGWDIRADHPDVPAVGHDVLSLSKLFDDFPVIFYHMHE